MRTDQIDATETAVAIMRALWIDFPVIRKALEEGIAFLNLGSNDLTLESLRVAWARCPMQSSRLLIEIAAELLA